MELNSSIILENVIKTIESNLCKRKKKSKFSFIIWKFSSIIVF